MCRRRKASKHTNKQTHRQVSHTTAKGYTYRHMNMHACERKQQGSKRASREGVFKSMNDSMHSGMHSGM
jgi:hypothetical protein